MLTSLEWFAYLAVNLTIALAYFLIPKKLVRILREPGESIHGPKNIHLIAHFVFFCGVHHLVMVPLMFLMMQKHYQSAFWLLLAVDITVAIVSMRALIQVRGEDGW